MKVTVVIEGLVEVDITEAWDDNCTLAQVKKQATDAAFGRLRALKEDRNNGIAFSMVSVRTIVLKADPRA